METARMTRDTQGPASSEQIAEMVRQSGYDAAGEARQILRATRAGALGTLDRGHGFPLTTLVNVATDMDGAPILLTSRLSLHTGNMDHDGRVSLLLAQTGKGDPLAHPRLTVIGRAVKVERSGEDGQRLRRRFLARHPKSELYADFPDFSFWRVEMAGGHMNGGFARAAELGAADLTTVLTGADEIVAIEAEALAHMNEDHADALALYARVLCGQGAGRWKATGIDPDGLDLTLGDRTARLAFPQRITDGRSLRLALKALADKARETLARENLAGAKAGSA
jgi:putative heme iron utilization protein